MSDDFQVGDVVVRIAGSSRPMPIGAIDRVTAVEMVWFDNEPATSPGLVLLSHGRPPIASNSAWNPHNFRKLPRADEQFTAQMRACKPIRVPA